MQRIRKSLEVVFGTKVRVQLVPIQSEPLQATSTLDNLQILLPVTVIRIPSAPILKVLRHRRDPDSRKAHALDVVQLVDDALPGATAVSLHPVSF